MSTPQDSSSKGMEVYVTYEATAREILSDSDILDALKRALPNLTPNEEAQLETILLGAVHEGIIAGLNLGRLGFGDDPLAILDAYRFGTEEGYSRGLAAGTNEEGQESY